MFVMHWCILCNNILIKSDLSLLCENNFITMFQLTLGCTRERGEGGVVDATLLGFSPFFQDCYCQHMPLLLVVSLSLTHILSFCLESVSM